MARHFRYTRIRHRLLLENLESRLTPAVANYIPDEILISFKPGAPAYAQGQALGLVQGSVAQTLHTQAMIDSGAMPIQRVKLAAPGVSKALAALANNPNIAFAEPNYIYTQASVSNDPYYTSGSLWGMYSNDLPAAVGPSATTNAFGSQAEKAWNDGFTGSKSVYVGIIDEGYQYTHPDLAANAAVNPGEVPGDAIDNDGNGYIDDVYGWDFAGNNNSVYDGTGDDHGTHVAGTIGGKGGNGAGVAGISWDVSLLSGKFLGASGGTTSGAILAVDYFTNLKTRQGLNIVATNNSWGGGGFSQGLLDAINRAGAANLLFIAAAGNNGANNDGSPFYPANYNATNLISVAAIDSAGNRASFTNYGATTVDLGAPGVGINSTVPTDSYASYSGTSMATPHVTGTAALYASRYPGATADQIKQAILQGATPTTSMAGVTVTGGRLNTWATLQIAPAESLPVLTIPDAQNNEGNSGSSSLAFTLTLSKPSANPVTVNFATANGTATAGTDYTGSNGSITFNPGDTSATISIDILGDTAFESNEAFQLNLSAANGATIGDGQGVGTILNDDAAPVPTLTIDNVSKKEGNTGTTRFTFTLLLSAVAPAGGVTVVWSTANGTATAGSDYVAGSGTITIPAGSTSRTVSVTVRGDRTAELDETFFVNLASASGAVIGDSQGVGTILNDDRGTVAGVSVDPFTDAALISWLYDQGKKPV